MRAKKTCVLLTGSLVALALTVGGCGNSPSDGGSGSTSTSSNGATPSDSSYGY